MSTIRPIQIFSGLVTGIVIGYLAKEQKNNCRHKSPKIKRPKSPNSTIKKRPKTPNSTIKSQPLITNSTIKQLPRTTNSTINQNPKIYSKP